MEESKKVNKIFVYGYLRPDADDDNGKTWVKHEHQKGMLAQKAIVKNAKLYNDAGQAVALLDFPKDQIVGWVLSHPDEKTWEQRLENYDTIEGHYRDTPEESYYERGIVKATLLSDVVEGSEKNPIGKPGEEVEVHMYYQDADLGDLESVKNGDWLQREIVEEDLAKKYANCSLEGAHRKRVK